MIRVPDWDYVSLNHIRKGCLSQRKDIFICFKRANYACDSSVLPLLLPQEFWHSINWRGRTLMLSRRGFQGYESYAKSCFFVNLLSSSALTGYRNSPRQHKWRILKPGVAVTARKLSHYANIPFHLIELCTEESTLNVGKNVRTSPRINSSIIGHEII